MKKTILITADETGVIDIKIDGFNNLETLGVLHMYCSDQRQQWFTKKISPEKEIKKTPITEWIDKHDLSIRLSNILLTTKYNEETKKWDGNFYFSFIEDVTRQSFMRIRNAGKKSWEEFCEARKKDIGCSK